MLLRPSSLSTLRLAKPPPQGPYTVSPQLNAARDHRRRHFSQTTTLLNTATPTHYDVLKVPPNATHAELKQQFYVLSKETHPDRNRNDPQASERFAQISESYSVLANPEKRKRYDRDVMRAHHSHRHHHHHHHGSHSSRSGSYAGSRPASGLSKRRSAFKGPPPSFYAHGNAAAHTAKQPESQSSSHTGPGPNMAGTFNASAYTEHPSHYDPAFNASRVYRTQTHEDYRRANRRAAEVAAAQAMAEDDSNFWTRFIVVSGVLVLGISLATLIAGSSHPTKGGLTRADGSRRDRGRDGGAKKLKVNERMIE